MIAFEGAWARWAEGREDMFLRAIPEALQEPFLQRVSEGRNGEVRKTVQAFFCRFTDSFSPRDLGNVDLVNKFIKLLETDPERNLPILRNVVVSATREELTSPPDWSAGSFGPRRQVVWIAERYAQFEEFFDVCEEILFTLAMNESEPNISNNATKIWQQLFRLQLSGTAVPLPVRLDKNLRMRLQSATQANAELLAGALAEILDFHSSRMLGPAVVGGRIAPSDWYPKPEDRLQIIESSLGFIHEASRHPIEVLARRAKDILTGDIEFLTRVGWVDRLRPLVSSWYLEEEDRARLVARLKHFLAWGKHPQGNKIEADYSQKLSDWVTELEPKSRHARFIEKIGARSWDHFGHEIEWQSELNQLAEEVLKDPSALHAEFDWLTSAEAKSAFEFGYALGSVDVSASVLHAVVDKSVDREPGLARGYIAGLLYGARLDPAPVNHLLDAWEEKNPLFAFHLALAGGGPVKVFDRAVRLVGEGKIPAYQFRNFTHWVGSDRVTNEQVLTAIECLLPHVEAGEEFCSDVVIDLLAGRFSLGEFQTILSIRRELIWDALTACTDHPGREDFWWGEILNAAAPNNPAVAIQLACKALVSNEFGMSDEALKILSHLASLYPNEVMSSIGAAMLDRESGVRFFFAKFPVFTALPTRVVIRWLEEVGADGAQKIARHLPMPYLDAEGNPVVPELTAWVLSHFEDDDRTFDEFCAGMHSLQTYSGDIASAHEREAGVARKFFNHPLKRIREWAKLEHDAALQNAQRVREWQDAMNP